MNHSICGGILAVAVGISTTLVQDSSLEKTNLFEARKGGYHTYRMPVIVVSKTGTILVHYDGREGGQRDWRNVLLGLHVLPGDGSRHNTASQ